MNKSLLAVAAVAAVSACSSPAPVKPVESVGMANPASAFCVEQGGRSEIRKAADGSEYGVCHLPDGRVVEEWEYFRSHKK